MRFGFHVSIAGGFSHVVERAKRKRCQTIQFFSRNPRSWRFSGLDPREADLFRQQMGASDIHPVFIHLPYLPNLASGDRQSFQKSVRAVVEELRRAETLAVPYIIAHLGRTKDGAEGRAVERIADGVNRALDRARNGVILLLENTAGEEYGRASQFERIAGVFAEVEARERIGLCLDIAHAYEEGFDLATEEGIESCVASLDRTVGFDRLHLLHLNDSKTALGSHVDRHWHIGQGHIGKEGFRRIINHPRFKDLPGIMETPRMSDRDDLRNLRTIANLVEARAVPFKKKGRVPRA